MLRIGLALGVLLLAAGCGGGSKTAAPHPSLFGYDRSAPLAFRDRGRGQPRLPDPGSRRLLREPAWRARLGLPRRAAGKGPVPCGALPPRLGRGPDAARRSRRLARRPRRRRARDRLGVRPRHRARADGSREAAPARARPDGPDRGRPPPGRRPPRLAPPGRRDADRVRGLQRRREDRRDPGGRRAAHPRLRPDVGRVGAGRLVRRRRSPEPARARCGACSARSTRCGSCGAPGRRRSSSRTGSTTRSSPTPSSPRWPPRGAGPSASAGTAPTTRWTRRRSASSSPG